MVHSVVAAGNRNGNDSMGVGREWEQESHARTPLAGTRTFHKSASKKVNQLRTFYNLALAEVDDLRVLLFVM